MSEEMEEKVDMYFELLHPEYEALPPEEQMLLMRDKRFIRRHFDEIDQTYGDAENETKRRGEDIDRQKIIANAVKAKKAEVYFALLHPEFDTLSPEEQIALMREQNFIRRHIDEIDRMYTLETATREDVNSEEIIKRIIENMKREITPQQIGQATINTPTSEKQEAAQMEESEKRNNMEKGEKDNI